MGEKRKRERKMSEHRKIHNIADNAAMNMFRQFPGNIIHFRTCALPPSSISLQNPFQSRRLGQSLHYKSPDTTPHFLLTRKGLDEDLHADRVSFILLGQSNYPRGCLCSRCPCLLTQSACLLLLTLLLFMGLSRGKE